MQFRNISQVALATVFVCSGHIARAENVADIVVTGAGLEETLPQELAHYGSAIEVVTEKLVKDGAFVDVAAALELVPGLYIKPASGPFSYVDLSLQGSRTQDILWAVDGIRINNRLYGGTSPNDTLPASMIERIEVLKGGESLFYGTQAAAGVINIVTRSFSDDFNGQINGSVDNRAGTNLDGYLRGSIGRHRFVAYASRNRSEGYQPFSAMEPSATDRKRGYELWSVGGKYQYDLGADFAFNLQYQHTEARLDNLSAIRTRESRNDRNEEIASVRLDYVGNDTVQFFLKGYFHDWKTAYIQIRNDPATGAPVVIYPEGTFWGYRDFGGSALVKLKPHRGLEYLVGYDYQNFSGRDDVLLIGKSKERVHAGTFQVRTTDDLSRRGRFAAGLRYNKTGGAQTTVWNVSGRSDVTASLYVEAIGGTSFILPDASQLYQIDPCCERGNPNLKPEESLNLNVATGGTLATGALTWRATYFRRRIDNLIDVSFNDPAFPDGIYVNVDRRVKVEGGEFQLSAVLAEAWHLSGSYTVTRARNQGSDRQRDRTPKQFASGSIAYAPADRPFGTNLSVNWVGDTWSSPAGFARQNYGNYAVVGAGFHLYPDGSARRHRLGINIENMFDNDYATRGYGSAQRDDGSGRFLYFTRGVPRTLRVSYGLSI
ncbi:TonB-dependent receptor plug domain-containing protein [Sphingomonas sp. KC8]|uniref:TonB-dependent receptor plug domain-containing protein n=1 Tax=Sphingomonas sp. KC8 TaxID=1030157 RepID=UPI00024893BF|nr:TonB-dependent receptor [Sphingomonas sp. KC8]ARS27799.1 TonB-dependent receptor for transport vitamin B12 [Sphingomonas sp. KC8]